MEGPYTLEQINADLSARKYKDSDYWAWHQNLTAWVPLYAIGGVCAAADTTFLFARPAAPGTVASASPPKAPAADTAFFLASHAPKPARILGRFEPTSSAPAASTVLAAQQPQVPIRSSALEPAGSAVAKPTLDQTKTSISPAVVSIPTAPAGSGKAEIQAPAKPTATPASTADTTISLASHAPKPAKILGQSETTTPAPAASTVLAALQPQVPVKSSALEPAGLAVAKPTLDRTKTPISPEVVSIPTAPAGSAKAEDQAPAKPTATQAVAVATSEPLPRKPQTTLSTSASLRRRPSATRNLRTPAAPKSPSGTPAPRAGRRPAKSAQPRLVKKRRTLSAPPAIKKLAHA